MAPFAGSIRGPTRATQAPDSWEQRQRKVPAVIHCAPSKTGVPRLNRFSGFLRSTQAGEYLEQSKGNRTRDDNSVSCHLVAVTSRLFNIYGLFFYLCIKEALFVHSLLKTVLRETHFQLLPPVFHLLHLCVFVCI